jgi:glutamate/tyrosine decarboxylase-like PLP-dependent enzyme
MSLETDSLPILQNALERLGGGFTGLPDAAVDADTERMATVLLEVAERMQDNYPYHHPLYAGQMLKPPHPIARLAYALSLWINPNNHALDGGRASSAMEKESVAEIARMLSWETHLGHLCGGGTMANLEALWVSGHLNPGKAVAASDQAHYTHKRISDVLQLPFRSIPCDSRARIDLNALESELKRGDIGTVVATMGTTATGSVDPLTGIIRLQERYGFRLHADAAYGGYYVLASNLDSDTREAFDSLHRADSIAIDPHKHGLQPYGCGCILFHDPDVGRLYKHDSPYTYFTSSELHLGEISLECSRAGASAVALWATQRLLPLIPGGEFAAGLDKSRQAALTLFHTMEDDGRFRPTFRPELDIVVWTPQGERASEVSELSRETFERAAERDLHLAVASLPAALMSHSWPDIEWDRDHIVCLRSCLMKPEHLEWIDRIWETLVEVSPS